MTFVCEECRNIDFTKALNLPPNSDSSNSELRGYKSDCGVKLDEGANRFADSPNPDCPVCQILTLTLCPCEREWASDPGLEEEAAKQPYTLQALSFRTNCLWTAESVPEAKDCTILLSTRGVSSASGTYSNFVVESAGYVVCLPKDQEHRVFIPQVIADSLDIVKAKAWLNHCERNHDPTTCNQKFEPLSGMRVIDCEILRVVAAEPGMLWVALSYVWGFSPSVEGDTRAPLVAERLPRTVQNAIQVTKDLGYRYLWVDRYCIDQRDQLDRLHQIAHMDAIYRGSDLTIICAAGSNEDFGLPGIGTTKRKKQPIVELESCTIIGTGPDPVWQTRQSRWASRGWTFQEGLLSRRRLIFTETQAYFECDKTGWMEALGGLELLDNPYYGDQAWASEPIGPTYQSRHLRARKHWYDLTDAETAERLQIAMRIALAYSERSLTYDKDALNAFAGIARYLHSTEPPVSHLFGIPYMSGPRYRDQAETYFTYCLSWFHQGGQIPPRRRDHFPSWSWAGWEGRMRWMHGKISYEGIGATELFLRDIYIEEDGQQHLLADFLEGIDLDQTSAGCTENMAICFEARVVTSSVFSAVGDSDADSSVHSGGTSVAPSNSNGEDDIQQWDCWRAGEHFPKEKTRPPCSNPYRFIEKIESGEWHCLLVCDYQGNGGFSHRRFLMVIEGLPDGISSRRVGSIVLNDHPYDHMGEFFAYEGLAWKRIRLV